MELIGGSNVEEPVERRVGLSRDELRDRLVILVLLEAGMKPGEWGDNDWVSAKIVDGRTGEVLNSDLWLFGNLPRRLKEALPVGGAGVGRIVHRKNPSKGTHFWTWETTRSDMEMVAARKAWALHSGEPTPERDLQSYTPTTLKVVGEDDIPPF